MSKQQLRDLVALSTLAVVYATTVCVSVWLLIR